MNTATKWFLTRLGNSQRQGGRRPFRKRKGAGKGFPANASEHEVHKAAHGFIEIAGSLDAAIKDSEPDFMNIGHQLQLIHSDAATLTRQILDAVDRIGGDSEESLLRKTRERTKAGLSELRGCRTEVADKLDRVDEIVGGLGNLDGMCTRVEKIAMFLRVVGLNIDVESRRSTASKRMFSLVAQEMGRLSGKVMELAGRIRDDAASAEAQQLSVHGEMLTSMSLLNELARDAEQAVQEAVGEIEKFMGLSLEALEQAGSRAREISGAVSDIVVEIQFHDKMRQRIEHITDALRLFSRRETDEGGDGQTDYSEENIGFISSVTRLQIVQLKEVIAEVAEGHQKNMAAFSGIGGEVQKLKETLFRLRSGREPASGSREASTEGPFAPLESALRQLRSIVGKGYGLLERMREATSRTSVTAARLSAHTEGVRNFSFETRLMALNAVVKASRLGDEGRTLEVLAQEVRGLADQSNVFASDVDGFIGEITARVHDLQAKDAHNKKETDGVSPPMTMNGGVDEIAVGYARFEEDASDAVRRAETLETVISQTKNALAFLPALADRLTQGLRQLEKTERMLGASCADQGNLTQGEIDRLLETYTMQQERDVYEQHLGPVGDPPHPPAQEPGGETFKEIEKGVEVSRSLVPVVSGEQPDDEDDLGDNVELF